ncbi:4-hydroxybenzoate octaprenyltransferase [Methylococcus capsulatus]|uniref:4-hydroxybenzoate octaprenyltransferase n=1 Tax=Methylococcus capsulatus TaxID=414 RepID=UPI002FD8A4D3
MNVPHSVKSRADAYWRLMRFDKPIGIFLLLWPALWALWIAGEGRPDPGVAVVIVFGVVLMRAAGCVINDYADREFDPHVERTRLRPIAAGEVTSKEALILFMVLCLTAFALVLTMNGLTIALSVLGAFLAASYPFTKRYTHLPQAYLGLAFGWAIPMTFAAQTGSIPVVAWALYAATVLWALIYDTMYAMVDRDDDVKIGIKSTAILFGKYDREIIGALQIAMLAILAGIGRYLGLGGLYALGLAAAAGFSVYQQVLIFRREKSKCFRAFLNNHWFGAAVFAGLFADYLWAG